MNDWKYERRSNKTYAALFVIAILSAALFGFQKAAADEFTSATIAPRDLWHDTNLPYVLSGADAERYRLIELLQRTAQWGPADHEIDLLKDRLLLGHILAQRYLHPRYHTSYRQLAAWLDAYADQPDAKAIYALALKRAPTHVQPPKPITGVLGSPGLADSDIKANAVHSSHHTAASPRQLWRTGLIAWQHGQYDAARRAFSALAELPDQSPWTISAAAFWTARAELKTRRPKAVAHWLGLAATHPHTFYGLLARRLLGIDTYFDFNSEAFTNLDTQLMTGTPAGRRVLAYLQIGDETEAEAQLRLMAARGSSSVLQAVIATADRANMPALSLRLAAILNHRDGRDHNQALYPIPHWTPRGGFTVDRALLFGVMRQESKFAPRVVSGAGARGLMQLMPATAHSMAAQLGADVPQHDQLSDPETNLMLAQKYIQTLLKNEHIDDNLMFFALAYNGGPGALDRAKAAMPNYRRDPLLFLETFPVGQSRAFTKRIMANYWIYRLRFGQPTPGLDSLAEGTWPIYTALDHQHKSDDRRIADNR